MFSEDVGARYPALLKGPLSGLSPFVDHEGVAMSRDDRAEHADQPRDEQARGARRKGRPSRTKREMPAPLEGGTVTALRALDPRGARFEVEIGGQRRVVSSELIGDFRLSVGRVIDAALVVLLSEGIRRLAVFDRAVAILARRPRAGCNWRGT